MFFQELDWCVFLFLKSQSKLLQFIYCKIIDFSEKSSEGFVLILLVFKLGFVNETEWSNSYLDKTTSQVKSRTYQFISHKINFLILLYSFMQMVSNKFVIVHEKKFDGESKKDCLMSGQLLSNIIFGMLMYLKFQTALENIT